MLVYITAVVVIAEASSAIVAETVEVAVFEISICLFTPNLFCVDIKNHVLPKL